MKPVEITRMRALYRDGATISELAIKFDCSRKTVRKYLSPAYAKSVREKVRGIREGEHEPNPQLWPDKRKVKDDAEALKAKVPADTRELTERICGDPLPGRSVLDRMGGTYTPSWTPPVYTGSGHAG